MREFFINIRETLERQVKVNAETVEKAIGIVEEQYRHQEHVLDAEDFTGVEFLEVGDYERRKELQYIFSFVAEGSFDQEIECDQLRSLWTAYCLHHGLDADTSGYDNDLLAVWKKINDVNRKEVGKENVLWSDYDSFDLYMVEFLS